MSEQIGLSRKGEFRIRILLPLLLAAILVILPLQYLWLRWIEVLP